MGIYSLISANNQTNLTSVATLQPNNLTT